MYKTGLPYFLKEKARELSITGRTFYLSDHSLFLIAMGETNNMESFVHFCKTGNIYSRIGQVEIKEQPIFDFSTFEVYQPMSLNMNNDE